LTDAYLKITARGYDVEVKADDLKFHIEKVEVYEGAKQAVITITDKEINNQKDSSVEGTITIDEEDYDKLLKAIIEGHGGKL